MTDLPPKGRPGEKDQVRPFHAKDVSTGQEAADLVAATIKHAAEREEAAKTKKPQKQQPKWMLPVGLNLGVLAGFLLVAQPSWVEVSPIAGPPAEERVDLLRNSFVLAVGRIESFRIQNDRLPASLTEAGASYAGIEYAPQGDSTYILISSVGEMDVVYNSAVQSVHEWGADIGSRIGG